MSDLWRTDIVLSSPPPHTDSSVLNPQPIPGERALVLQDENDLKTMVISDVHIGFEEELMRDGIYIPAQTAQIIERVKQLIINNNIQRVVVNGDLKHRVPKTQWKYRKRKLDEMDEVNEGDVDGFQKQMGIIGLKMRDASAEERKELQQEFERLERQKSEYFRKRKKKRYGILEKSELELRNVAQFLRSLLEQVKVDVIPGNHDGRIQKELENSFPSLISEPGLSFHDSEGITVGNSGIFHGHAWPLPEVMSQAFLISGHGHAAIMLTDSLGVRNFEQCWLRAHLKENVRERYLDAYGEVVLMPSFNDFFRGSPVNRKGRLLGPLFKNDYVDVDNGDVFLLDGVNLGKVRDLRQFAVGRRGW